ncbi:MAG: WD40/YVTN/BNR-like repeat-containing protein [Gemmatimonadota bacterium]
MPSGRIVAVRRGGPGRRALQAIPLVLAAAAGLVVPAAAQDRAAARVDPALLAGLKARSIGPAGMSGRIAAVAGVPGRHEVLYVGAATGGVWKSVNRGLTWEPVFDEQPVASVGAIAVSPTSPDVVWVGTGEGNVRNSTSVGNGVYRSLDGGRTWEHLGLENTERIHKIVLDPRDPEVAYVAALGHLWGENPERGVYKTTDGGRTWRRVLYVDERTGAADLAMDPSNPNKLFASLWQFRRWPWSFESGGESSGLYVTHDAGESWKRITADDGLPRGPLGRIGVGIASSDPDVVYALVEAKRSALVRSDDGGVTWRAVNRSTNVAPRPFYYARIWVDPERPDRLYNVHGGLQASDDGGKTFKTIASFRSVHPDHHAFWIDPADPEFVVTGNDGGLYMSEDRGATWDFGANLPLAQFYHIRVDGEMPYHVYGGLQDNGSWKGPSRVRENGGIRNHHWEEVGFGDGFDTSPDPEDPMRGYAMSQRGFLIRWDLRTGERKSVRPPPPDPETELRFNWNAAFAQDPFDPATIYYGSQFVHRSTDRGDSWEVISEDLTTDNPEWQKQRESGGLTPDQTGAENFTTILAIEPSPLDRGVIWAGTDDGRLHVTRDGGETWTSVEGNVRGVPPNTWIPHIEASPHDAGTAFVVFDNHRRSDWTPYVYKTADFGRTWTRLAGRGSGPGPRTPETGPDGVWGYALSIAQDPVDPDLLFLGTEFGLYVSLDGGGAWMRFTHGVPPVGVRDLAIQEREADLVLGTHGRAAYVLDDISPLRGLSPETLEEPLHLFEIPDAVQYVVKQTGASRFPGDEEFRGENRPYGALLTFSANRPGLPRPDEEVERERGGEGGAAGPRGGAPGEEREEDAERPPRVKVEVEDPMGDVIRTFERPVKLGVNRIAWNLRRDAFRRPQTGEEEEEESFFGGPSGAPVLPGTYTVRLTLGEASASGTVRVLPDPRQRIPPADRRARYDAILEAGGLRNAVADAITRIYDVRREIELVLRKARRADREAAEKAVSEEESVEAAGGAEGPGEEVTEPETVTGQERGAEEELGEETGAAAGARGPHAALIEAGMSLEKALTELEKRMWVPPDTKGIVAGDHLPWSKVNRAISFLSSSWERPSPSHLGYLEVARGAADGAVEELNRLLALDVAEFRRRVEASDLTLFRAFEPLGVERP